MGHSTASFSFTPIRQRPGEEISC
ncbi:hypothetical protein NC653_041581 [Populus alba x Populus x berolinensis]|uniref:Uncharacterized protein n=1 Tax=Populus alba x Populus x berolinensis TaxID=444605 RepID=A0AAD6L956_9ROSI|nr:hypothetical protein NC653_041581 [Populus alba x Populus x berolinensis]